MKTFEQLATSRPLADPESRVKLGFGFDFYFLPKLVVQDIFAKVRSLGAKVITSHFIRNFIGSDTESLPVTLTSYGLLDGGVVLSHAGGATAEDAKLLHEAKCFVSATPSTEQSMAVGPPVPFRQDLPGIDSVCSLGVDCHSATSSSMVNEMRLALQTARGIESEVHVRKGQWPTSISHTTAEVFNMGTVQGARALRMEGEIGSIQVGKKADLVVFDALSPAMVCAAKQDPVMAIVMHSSIGDIDAVVVDGQLRKQDGKLLPARATEWHGDGEFVETGRSISWREISGELISVQKRLVSKLQDCGLPEIEAYLRQRYGHS
jgi:Amidohydrolase family